MTPGCSAWVTVPAWPGESFPGRLTVVGGVQDETTRTVRARVEIANPRKKLKPGMFAQVRLTCPAGERILVLDDLLATGGTAAAAARLVERQGGVVEELVFLIELSALKGRENLQNRRIHSIMTY